MIDVTDKWGFTPLMYAVAMGYRESASLLIKSGADLSATIVIQDKMYSCVWCAFVRSLDWRAIQLDLIHM